MSLNRMTVAALVSLGLLAMASEAKAMDPDFSDPVASCGFPSTVGVNGALCQGAFLGQGLVLTAAHCVDELSENPADLYFGDRYLNDSQSEFTYEGASCILHPSWNSSSQEGVDLAVCNFADTALDIPPAIMTPPDGCEVAYLRHILRNISTCDSQADDDCFDGIPGYHVSAGPQGESGPHGDKYYGDSVIVRQETWEKSPSMLVASIPGLTDYHLIQGDSGAPFYMEMPDGSWRMLGVHSGRFFR